MKRLKNKAITIGQTSVLPGQTKEIDLFVSKLYDFTEVHMPVRVISGKEPGPCLFICASIHGDEVNGVEIIKRLSKLKTLKNLKGTLILAPIVNVLGFNHLSRYLPDRRDLNRSFPGSNDGPLASRLADLFIKEIVSKCTHGIDLHTGSVHRLNLPQIRACLKDKKTKKLAEVFAAPVILDAEMIEGSLRKACYQKGIPLLVFEGGEALRYNEYSVRSALKGISDVMCHLSMIDNPKRKAAVPKPLVAKGSFWVRAPQGGIVRIKKKLGSIVNPSDLLATISDPLGNDSIEVRSKKKGVIIGESLLPLANRGDALLHIATFSRKDSLNNLDAFEDKFDYEEGSVMEEE